MKGMEDFVKGMLGFDPKQIAEQAAPTIKQVAEFVQRLDATLQRMEAQNNRIERLLLEQSSPKVSYELSPFIGPSLPMLTNGKEHKE